MRRDLHVKRRHAPLAGAMAIKSHGFAVPGIEWTMFAGRLCLISRRATAPLGCIAPFDLFEKRPAAIGYATRDVADGASLANFSPHAPKCFSPQSSNRSEASGGGFGRRLRQRARAPPTASETSHEMVIGLCGVGAWISVDRAQTGRMMGFGIEPFQEFCFGHGAFAEFLLSSVGREDDKRGNRFVDVLRGDVFLKIHVDSYRHETGSELPLPQDHSRASISATGTARTSRR